MRCLVTGADGFIGAHLCAELQRRGHEVTASSLNRQGATSLSVLRVACRVEYGDVTDAAYCARLVASVEPEWVFHLAAVSIVRQAATYPATCLRTNVLGTLNVLEAAAAAGDARVLVASSDKAYGDHGGQAYKESDPLTPTGAYEVSKCCADHIARLYQGIVVRCANVFGPGDLAWSRLVPASCRRAVRGEAPQVYAGAEKMQREWIDVHAAVDAYILLAMHGHEGEAYNVGTGWTASALEVARLVAEYAEAPEPVIVGKAPYAEIGRQVLDSSRLREMAWKPALHPGSVLKSVVQWYRGYLNPRADCEPWDGDAPFFGYGDPAGKAVVCAS